MTAISLEGEVEANIIILLLLYCFVFRQSNYPPGLSIVKKLLGADVGSPSSWVIYLECILYFYLSHNHRA